MKGFIIGFTLLITLSSVRSQEDKGLLTCNPGSSRCANNSTCVPYASLCDYKKDCDDLSDENFLLCQKFQEKRATCQSGTWHHPNYGCQDYTTICAVGYYNAEQFLPLCDEIKNGLKPFQEITDVQNEISAIRREESKLKEVFGQLASSYHSSNFNSVESISRCPPLYVNIGSKCVALFSIAQVSWPEAKQFCKSISGTLGVLRKMEDYPELQDYMKENELSANYWIGGKLEQKPSKNMSTWTWIDGHEIEMGAPYWTVYKTPGCTKRKNSEVCFDYSIMPQGIAIIPNGCLAMDYQYYYYFSDANCYEKRSPLCFLASPLSTL